MTYEVYVISNSDLFREGLNAVAAFCQSDGFRAATWIGSAISIIMTAIAYVKQHDLLLYLKWLAVYFFVFHILLGVPSTVAIINTSDPTIPAQVVDHVPFGLAFPAHLITAFGYGFSSDMETVFALPDEASYTRTGMLFGSNLFRLSLASQLDDPSIMSEMNNYVRSCVVGDILINHKYSFNDLLHAKDLWGLMIRNPSPIRGIFVNGHFNTCIEAAHDLTQKINTYSAKTAPAILSRFIPTRNLYTPAAINTLLASTYQYFKASSDTASDILRQNIAINAFRAGLKNYAAETGSIAGLENIANTMAMNNTRLAWATSRHIGIQTLPLMQVVLLLLLLCIFPLIVVLTLIPGLGLSVFKNYLYSLIWLESWPILYAVLNMAMNFYISAGDHGSVTLSNINLLAQEHSDIAGIAGYLVLAIPFLSLGIVKGMAFTFNNAAQYLGGMMHSIAQGSSAAVVTGNYSLGNVSTNNATANNLHANKHDTNFANFQGLSTQQLGNAATVTDTPVGHEIYSTTHGMSQLATSEHAAQSAAMSLSQQVDRSLTSALSHNTQYMESRSHHESLGATDTSGVSSNVDQAMSKISHMTHSLAQTERISAKDALQKLSMASGTASLTFSEAPKFFGVGGGTTQNASTTGSMSSTHNGDYSTGADKNISASEAHDFREAINTIRNYSETHAYSKQNSDSENQAIQMGADLNQAERLSKNAQFIETHSNAINTNFSQAFANYVERNYPNESKEILSATGDSPLLDKQQRLADQFVQAHAKQLANQFDASGSNIEKGFDSSTLYDRQKYTMQNYQQNSQNIKDRGKEFGIKQSQQQSLSHSISGHMRANANQLAESSKDQSHQQSKLSESTDEMIHKGKSYAQKGVTRHMIDGVKDAL